MLKKGSMVWVRVPERMKRTIESEARSLEMSTSEYIRYLISLFRVEKRDRPMVVTPQRGGIVSNPVRKEA